MELQARTEAVVSENNALHRATEESLEQTEGATNQDLTQVRLLMQEVGMLSKSNAELKTQLAEAQQSAKQHVSD